MSDEEDYEYEYTDDEDGDDGNAMDVSDTQPRAVRKMSGVDLLNDGEFRHSFLHCTPTS